MVKRLRHVGIVVADFDMMSAFYANLLGCEFMEESEESDEITAALGVPDAELTTMKMEIPGGGMLELLRYDRLESRPSATIQSPGRMHLSFTVENVDDLCAYLTRNGIRLTGEPCVSGHAKVAFCLDPEGNLLELVEMLH